MSANSRYMWVASAAVCLLGAGFFWQKTSGLSATQVDAASHTSQNQPNAMALDGKSSPDAAELVAGLETTCEATMTAKSRLSARVQLDIDAPCRPGERLTLHHSGFMFTQTLNAAGRLSVVVPAMTETAVFMADFAYGQDLITSVPVPDMARYDRIALQWQGTSGLELHALEFGASYNEPGHIWYGTNMMGGAGQMFALGDATQVMPQLIQIYSLLRDTTALIGDRVSVSVEAEVTADNCNHSVSAQLIERRNNTLRTRDLLLNMPVCEAVGDFLVLNNLVESLKIAAN